MASADFQSDKPVALTENMVEALKFAVAALEKPIDFTKTPLIGIYISAAWCPPCQRFTPRLAEFYKNVLRKTQNVSEQAFEIIYLSADRNPTQYSDYRNKMPWAAIDFDKQPKRYISWLGVNSFPTLLLIDALTNTLLTAKGVEYVTDRPDGSEFAALAVSLVEDQKNSEKK